MTAMLPRRRFVLEGQRHRRHEHLAKSAPKDIDLREHGAVINARMGLNTWAAFTGTDADAMVAGDIAMLAPEVTPVLKALRANGINVVAIHQHMTTGAPAVFFLHYFGTGPAATLAAGVRAAI